MPKMKTRRAAKKRFKLTAKGKVKIKKSNLRHNLGKKTTKQKRDYKAPSYLNQVDVARAKRCLPYA